MERRLAAILAADVVGYSRLVGSDEEGTLSTLKAHRAFIDAQVEFHNGRVFGSAGDSVVAEFASPVQAVRCAVEIQQEMEARNAALGPGGQMHFRMGIHLGDVVAEGENLLGDGVNIAARLEALAPTGGICVSKSVAEQVAGKVEVEFAEAGVRELKNVATPVEVCTWPTEFAPQTDGGGTVRKVSAFAWVSLAAAVLITAAAAGWWLFGRSESRLSAGIDLPRIAVLPFDDFSTGTDKGWLSDAIAEGLITDLARYREFQVIARNSSFSFRDAPTDITEVADTLDADFVVEGSKQKSGDRLRVTVQLINGSDGTHLWADEFDADIGELFEVQSQIVRRIGTQLGHELIWKGARSGGEQAVNALHYFLLGNAAFNQGSPDTRREAATHYLNSIEADPEAPFGYAGMASLIWSDLRKKWVYPDVAFDELLKRGTDYAEKAIDLDETYYLAHIARGDIHMSVGEHEDAVVRYQIAAEQNPSSSVALAAAADPLLYLDRAEEAIALVERAIEINPVTPGWYFNALSRAYWSVGRCEEGVQTIKRTKRFRPWDYRALIVNLVCLREIEDAERAAEKLLELDPEFTVSGHGKRIMNEIDNPGYLERWLTALSAAGLPDG